MTSIEFAEKYAGTRFCVPKEFLPAEVLAAALEYTDYECYAQIVGYFAEEDNRIVIELEEGSFRKHCWLSYEDVKLVVDKSDLFGRKQSVPTFLAIDYRQVKIPQRRLWTDEVKEKEIAPPKLYTSRCPKCNEPARKFGKQVMCSNRSCNTRAKLFKTFDIKPSPKLNYIRCTHVVHGKPCGNRAIYSRKRDGYYIFTCEKQEHIFNVKFEDMKKNDILMLSISGTDINDRIWSGTQWETY